ncbi:hypothetical protein HN832_02760 [archaeon]|jgi:hypothetical protein|nr:hypothetical protein [archaeon]MBT4373276.1 hypothetical protein [archaeon]MBT4531621.1 hypothetical protein [archaeon]MBT7001201.1 hypothetical protein [archaeon]MBT7282313.1 hypothetical protein [archaeon]
MKKSLLFALLLLLPLTSAIEFNINSEYSQGGAILTTISGNFQETLTEENILFYRGHVRAPFNYELKKIKDIYYLYVNLLDKSPNNYSIVLEEIEYLQGNKILNENIQRNFSITNATVDFTINSGAIITEDDFSITIQNLQDKKISVASDYIISTTTDLYSGEIKTLDFEIVEAIPSEIQTLKLSSSTTTYEIPIYVLEKPRGQTPVKFEFDISSLNVSLDLNKNTTRTIYVKNTGEETIFQVKLSLDDELERYAQLSKYELFNLSSDFLYPVELTIVSGDLPDKILENLTAFSAGVEIILPINLTIFPGIVEEVTTEKSCSEIGGATCSANACDGIIEIVEGKNCCLGLCEEETSEGGTSFKLIGWILLVVLILVGILFYFKKFRGAKAPAKGAAKLLAKMKKE